MLTNRKGLLVAANRDADFVCLHMFYEIGMKDDGDMPGLSHICEHIVEMQNINNDCVFCTTNAYLNIEYTCFYARGLIENAQRIVDLQSTLLEKAFKSVDEKMVENEKRRILLEIRTANSNVRRKNIMQLEKKVLGQYFSIPIVIDPVTFLKISVEDIKNFLLSRYCAGSYMMIYSGKMEDLTIQDGHMSLMKNRFESKKIKNGLYSHGCFACIAIEPVNGKEEYFKIKILLEVYRSIWNVYKENKIVSAVIKLFDCKILLTFEFQKENQDEMIDFTTLRETDIYRFFDISLQKVKTETLYHLHDLASYNIFLYKAFRYMQELYIDYRTIKDIFLNIDVMDIIHVHRRLMYIIEKNSSG